MALHKRDHFLRSHTFTELPALSSALSAVKTTPYKPKWLGNMLTMWVVDELVLTFLAFAVLQKSLSLFQTIALCRHLSRHSSKSYLNVLLAFLNIHKYSSTKSLEVEQCKNNCNSLQWTEWWSELMPIKIIPAYLLNLQKNAEESNVWPRCPVLLVIAHCTLLPLAFKADALNPKALCHTLSPFQYVECVKCLRVSIYINKSSCISEHRH